jgi:hypothetical protein
MKETLSCARCNHFHRTSAEGGECRESPPKVFMIPVRTMQGDGLGFQSVFPQVNNEVWCSLWSENQLNG